MTSISYFTSTSREKYSTQALDYIGNEALQKLNISNAADKIGISAGAIAGAMAEENNDYWLRLTVNQLSDDYALSGADPSVFAADVALFGFNVALTKFAWQLTFGTRTHAQWAADYFSFPSSAW